MSTPSLFEKLKGLFSSADTVIAVKSGCRSYLIKGHVPGVLLQDIDEILKERTGTAYIYHFGSSRAYRLTFSKTISQSKQ